MEISYNDDILKSKVQLIVHQCFCTAKRKSAKGLAAKIFKKYPYSNVYCHRNEDSIPGTIEVRGSIKHKERWVCAIYGQYHPGTPSDKNDDTAKNRRLWFKKALKKIGKIQNLRSIAFPYKIGCGLAKGKWSLYEKLISDFASNNPKVEVYIISNEDPPPKQYKYTFDFVKYLSDYMTVEKMLGVNLEDITAIYKKYEYAMKHPKEDNNAIVEVEFMMSDSPTWSTSNLEEYTRNNVPKGWEGFFEPELDIDGGSIHKLSKYLTEEAVRTEIYPELHLVYNAFTKLEPQEIKVIICGQDPYHDIGQAMGMSFSVPKGIKPPPSLKNIYKELKDEGFTIADSDKGDLSSWCKQGVLMLNTALTVRAHEAKSHSKKWLAAFTPALMKWLNENCDPLVLILWGGPAQEYGKYFSKQHKKVECPHPSPLSAYRGFFGSDCFNKANKELKKLKRDVIDWSL
ncbi:MAG TPA: uracil-DNA glycosylase [Saprospiraceae bacterium]|nr:uracil-DNA glycosylase [Saprospiraceae bacterium]